MNLSASTTVEHFVVRAGRLAHLGYGMKGVAMKETELITSIQAIFNRPQRANLLVPNGDDGAVFRSSKKVITCADVAVEGVHFDLSWSSYFEVGRKITAANLADIAAMGGWPEFLLLTVVLSERHVKGALELAEGIAYEADRAGAQVIGGDISRGSELSISITALGETERAILRSGARPGERVFVSSIPGFSAAGLEILKSGAEKDSELKERAVNAHKAPTLDYQKYQSAFAALSSAIDISDGLLVDAGHIAAASGVAIDLSSESLLQSELARLDKDRALKWILSGGEDHVLLGTSTESIPGFVEIGKVLSGSGIFLDGKAIEIEGYSHDWQS
jgi:thiamine-monophosphate kinase